MYKYLINKEVQTRGGMADTCECGSTELDLCRKCLRKVTKALSLKHSNKRNSSLRVYLVTWGGGQRW